MSKFRTPGLVGGRGGYAAIKLLESFGGGGLGRHKTKTIPIVALIQMFSGTSLIFFANRMQLCLKST